MAHRKETHIREKQAVFDIPGSTTKTAIIVIAFALFFLIRQYLPLGDIDPELDSASVRTGLAILALAALLWLTEAMPLALTAILIPVMASLTRALDVSDSFSGFSHPLIFLFLGGFGLAAALSRQGIDRWLALRILKLGRGNFHLTAIAMFLVSAVLSMWISNTATVALLLPVALGILASLSSTVDENQSKKASVYLLLGIAYSASIGGIGTLIGTPPNAIAAANLKMGFTEWLKIGIPCVIILLPILVIVLRLLVKTGSLPQFAPPKDEFHFNKKRILTLAIFLCAIGCWLASSPLSAWLGIAKSFDSIVAVSAVLVLAGFHLVGWKDIDNATDWGVLLLFGGGITLSKILGNTGASYYLAQQIQQLTSGWPHFLLIGVVVLFVIFLTELSSNTASTALLVPIFAALATDMGIPPTQLILPLTVAASCAFMLPIATPPNAIVFGSGKINQREMMRVGLILNLTFAVILTVLGSLYF